MATACTLLFVPGDRPERFDKAVAAGPDVVVIDLEDAVAPGHKLVAREHVTRWLTDGGRAAVRVNSAGSQWYADDVAALATLGQRTGLVGVVLPMADDPQAATRLHQGTNVPVLALIETARGVLRASKIAEADGVVRLAFGALDFAADAGTDDPTTLAVARAQLVLASRAAGLEGPLDSVTTDVSSGGAAGADARSAEAVGMAGKLCVHPCQVGPVAAAFAPSPDQVEWARRVLSAGSAGGVTVMDDAMVDEPVLLRARRILQRAVGKDQS
ncbi:CoA ester lyase [Leekyejoonella antrihumi]|uniref:CoA ester lyase n=1 Tax=Leekyejoonella antrihumi TaxID=1660198 RepID=A0A563DZC9_9MICO|nr:CoA ester lyase [Leekyejoonella antrihumi]